MKFYVIITFIVLAAITSVYFTWKAPVEPTPTALFISGAVAGAAAMALAMYITDELEIFFNWLKNGNKNRPNDQVKRTPSLSSSSDAD